MSSLVPFSGHIIDTRQSRRSLPLAEGLLEYRPTEAQQLVTIGIDNSYSTFGSGSIREAERALPVLIDELSADPAVRASVLAAFTLFDDEQLWRFSAPFQPVTELVPPKLCPTGSTPLCTRLIDTIEIVAVQRKLVSRVLGADQHHSWILEITDGEATDLDRTEDARRAVQETALENGIEVHLFFMGQGKGFEFLNSLAQPKRPAVRLGELDVKKIFRWLTDSLRVTSRSVHGTAIEIPNVVGQLIPTE